MLKRSRPLREPAAIAPNLHPGLVLETRPRALARGQGKGKDHARPTPVLSHEGGPAITDLLLP